VKIAELSDSFKLWIQFTLILHFITFSKNVAVYASVSLPLSLCLSSRICDCLILVSNDSFCSFVSLKELRIHIAGTVHTFEYELPPKLTNSSSSICYISWTGSAEYVEVL